MILSSLQRNFLPYQVRWINDLVNPTTGEGKKFLLCDKAVRVGLSFAQAFKSFRKRLLRTQPPLNEIFASKNLKVAGEYMAYLRRFGEAIQQTVPGVIDLSTWTSECARLPGGNIMIVSSDPNSFRGMGADVTLDEVDFHDNQRSLFSAAQSRVQWIVDGQVSLFSSRSPNPSTFFAGLAHAVAGGKMPSFSYHRVTLDDAVGQGLAEKVPGSHQIHLDGTLEGVERCRQQLIADLRSQCASEDDFQREYYCTPAGQAQLVKREWYERNIVPDWPIADTLDHMTRYPDDVFVGIDCGIRDLTVVWAALHREDATRPPAHRDVYPTLCVFAMRGEKFDRQYQRILPIISHPDVTKVIIDQGSVGYQLAHMFADELGDAVEPYVISRPRKAKMLERMSSYLQMDRVTVPDDADCRDSILSMRRTVSENNVLTYEGGTQKCHGDYAIALALMLEAAEQFFKPVITVQSRVLDEISEQALLLPA
jgi:phage FluMu gp28-like protein